MKKLQLQNYNTQFLLCHSVALVHTSHIVSNGTNDCLETLITEMTYKVSRGTLNSLTTLQHFSFSRSVQLELLNYLT